MNNNILSQFSLYITKSSISDGIMRWSAINSDTESDLYGEKMTLELYKKMLGYIKNSIPPPKEFQKFVCSEYWCGGMPYVSLAHYPDLKGKAVLGQPTELFIDGKQLKAKGVFFDNPLGRATWKSLKEDENIPIDEERIRISIAFLDLAHKHGENGNIFKRESLKSVCADCVRGVEDKIYLDGYLVHLATTRKPVNTRTIMLTEDAIMAKKSEIKTRKDDALSIVKDADLVDAIDQEAMSVKSDVLIEMSEAIEETVTDAPVVLESKPSPKEDEDAESEEAKKEKKEKPEYKALTAEDVAEIVKSLLSQPKDPIVIPTESVVGAQGGEIPIPHKSALDISVNNLYNSINTALQAKSTVDEKLVAINPALQELGTAITSLVRDSSGEKPVQPVSNDQAMILEAVTSLKDTVKELATEVATMKAQTLVPSNVLTNRIPSPRSIPSSRSIQSQVQASLTGQPVPQVNPNSVANIVRRSVSQHLPLK